MALIRPRSAHVLNANRTGVLMYTVILAAMPGLLTLTWFFGWGPLITVIWACLVATACEALALSLRRRSVRFYLRDCSALVTGAMMGLALPHYAPWWLTLTGVGFAIVVAKHLYGGMGFNPFNPAMMGYALLLMTFPEPMTNNWATPAALLQTGAPDFLTTLGYIFGGHIPGGIDGYTAATPLTTLKMQANADAVATVVATPGLDNIVAWDRGWQWVGLAYLIGGLLLIERRIITWHIPVGMLGALLLCLLLFGEDRSRSALLLQLLGGGTVLAAFFVATDPVTSCTSKQGRLAYGFGLGVLTFVLRKAGGYADAAFAVLLMNFASPYIDHYTRPRTFGHAKARRGPGGKRQ